MQNLPKFLAVASYGGLTQGLPADETDYILITLGSITGLCREVVDELRERGEKVGLLKLRFLRPFPSDDLVAALESAKAMLGYWKKTYPLAMKATSIPMSTRLLQRMASVWKLINLIAGLGGRDISRETSKHLSPSSKPVANMLILSDWG